MLLNRKFSKMNYEIILYINFKICAMHRLKNCKEMNTGITNFWLPVAAVG